MITKRTGLIIFQRVAFFVWHCAQMIWSSLQESQTRGIQQRMQVKIQSIKIQIHVMPPMAFLCKTLSIDCRRGKEFRQTEVFVAEEGKGIEIGLGSWTPFASCLQIEGLFMDTVCCWGCSLRDILSEWSIINFLICIKIRKHIVKSH